MKEVGCESTELWPLTVSLSFGTYFVFYPTCPQRSDQLHLINEAHLDQMVSRDVHLLDLRPGEVTDPNECVKHETTEEAPVGIPVGTRDPELLLADNVQDLHPECSLQSLDLAQ